jgi:biopolymer transport protein ExbD
MRRRRGLPEPAGERIPNLAPMVDVIMVLLVFFMMGARFNVLREGMLATELDPRSGPGADAPIEIVPSIKIALEDSDDGAACTIYVMGEPLARNSFDELQRFLDDRRQAGVDTVNPVVIGAQSGVRWRFVIHAMDAAVRAGFRNVQFAVHLGS